MRNELRLRHYSRRTEEIYVRWVRRFVAFGGMRHPGELGAADVTAFLSHLAVHGRVSAATQNQALGALLFLYRDVLRGPVAWLDGLVRAKRTRRLLGGAHADSAREGCGFRTKRSCGAGREGGQGSGDDVARGGAAGPGGLPST